ncbi:MaoC family dehydratase N-terminal domain-containing protein [Actinoalloteichus hymeniacidonis]|uniref:UPF0336 protein TL08_02855 n=1 Tax=Actinoalloteichus hymeniacidonis TaxID=340345 RepID=A0AAC9HLL2_9PSEU|nr:MaoC family dehydratase N-terminal domain-containing protein [Actinoalloteichus hymeniacidonis]AOS61406.1 acyl dehydratase [Actinoalloteichus hymeniacidonis]MBB5910589.1 acyl dehydratase [Actinoalloteichus hymeniacidonis]
MALDQSFVGRVYPSIKPYEVSREKIREFADAVGATDPVHHDREAAVAAGHPDVIAPTTFAVILSMSATSELAADPELGLDYSRVVHGDQSFQHHRPIHAGDLLSTTATVEDVASRAGNDMITVRADIRAADDELVTVARAMLVARGTDIAPAPSGESAAANEAEGTRS